MRVKQMIRDTQPFHDGVDACNHTLAIVHELNRIDKHRELLLMGTSANVTLPAGTPVEIIHLMMIHTQGNPITPAEKARIGREIRKQHQVAPDIAFKEIGKLKTQAVVPALMRLRDDIHLVVDRFAAMYS